MKSNDCAGKVLGQYVLEQHIACSQMSTVYRARHLQLARPVAIKVTNAGPGDEFLPHFRREARLLARLEHASIMPLYDYGEQDSLAYLVMPYFPRGSLLDQLVGLGRRSHQQVLAFLQQAASVLDYVHSCGVVHLDLKPSNFLLRRDGRLVLSDFGIARVIGQADRVCGTASAGTAPSWGTPAYMPPEVILGDQIDGRADIYELGILLYQLMSGALPFQGSNTRTVLLKHLYEPPPPLHKQDATIAPAVDEVMQRALAKRREERYSSAAALALALEAAMTRHYSLVATGRVYEPEILARHLSSRMQAVAVGSGEYSACPGLEAARRTSRERHAPRQQSKRNRLRMSATVLLVIALVVLGLLVSLLLPPTPRITPAGMTASRARLTLETLQVVLTHQNPSYPGVLTKSMAKSRSMHVPFGPT